MLAVNSPRAKPLQVIFKWFGVPNSFKRIPNDRFDQFVDALEFLLVSCLPIQVILPSSEGPCDSHSSISGFSTTFPAFASSKDFIKTSRFLPESR